MVSYMCKDCGCEDYHNDDCGCGMTHHGPRGFHQRRFLTKEEKVKKLSDYAEGLQKELAAVQERIKELESK